MNEKKIEYLLKYLDLLLKAHEEGCKSYQEISATTKSIALELGLGEYGKSDSNFTIRENGDIHVNGKVVITRDGVIADSVRGNIAIEHIVNGLKKLGVNIK